MEFRLLREDEIDVRVGRMFGSTLTLLLYKDARCDMNILDEVVGPENWQRAHEVIDGNLYCQVGIWVQRHEGYGDWVWKQDVGTESNVEKEKGQASDAFKRACFNWGIGRELYTGPRITFFDGEYSKDNKGKCNDYFRVVKLEYEGRKIKRVTVLAEKTRKVKTFTHDTVTTKGGIFLQNFEKIRAYLAKQGIAESQVCEELGIKTLEDMTSDEWNAWGKEHTNA